MLRVQRRRAYQMPDPNVVDHVALEVEIDEARTRVEHLRQHLGARKEDLVVSEVQMRQPREARE
eukprot:786936-Rhodomonas_salina.3